ncbi:hypothetical protein BpHYR1_031709 [Brachionus plicatilis]|uniref:Uncharacterized protein n=1 Tax=Brachionus plicatilis TaxID=10195 RepID=A0A3M7QPN1_BRAPC|nr:hypothetical protein BpHYR1_031709 [Brachionus plicatilis]
MSVSPFCLTISLHAQQAHLSWVNFGSELNDKLEQVSKSRLLAEQTKLTFFRLFNLKNLGNLYSIV